MLLIRAFSRCRSATRVLSCLDIDWTKTLWPLARLRVGRCLSVEEYVKDLRPHLPRKLCGASALHQRAGTHTRRYWGGTFRHDLRWGEQSSCTALEHLGIASLPWCRAAEHTVLRKVCGLQLRLVMENFCCCDILS